MADSTSLRFAPEGAAGPRGESLIDRESHFTGTYRTPQDLRIEGRYEGEIECKGTVFVGESATVNARIVAGNVTVAGHCEGEIVCETRFEILRTGRVSGSVSSAVTVVHEGAFYQGELRMARGPGDRTRRDTAAPAPAPLTRTEPSPVRTPTMTEPPSPPRAAAPPPAPERTPPPSPRRRQPETPTTPETDEPELPASLITASAAPRFPNGNSRDSTPR
jgi:cytoskeletal protein CcmA (bactofilin family)